MDDRKKRISTMTAVLLVAVLVLASSTLYLSFYVSQAKPSGTGNAGAGTLRLPTFAAATGADQSGSASASSDSITVSGSGQVSYSPNEALLQVSVQTDNTTAVAATSSNAQDMTNVIRALNAIGISNSSIETQGYTLSANYANCYSSCVPQIIGYSVTNSLQVNITSSSPTELGREVGRVIDTSVKAGANGINLSFGASNSMLNQITNEALQSAVALADDQAKAIAGSLGVSISGVISASESSNYYPGVYGSFTAALATASTTTSAPTPISVGTQTVSATVTVVYSIS